MTVIYTHVQHLRQSLNKKNEIQFGNYNIYGFKWTINTLALRKSEGLYRIYTYIFVQKTDPVLDGWGSNNKKQSFLEDWDSDSF